MRVLHSIILVVVFSLFISACGAHRTTVVIIEPDPVQTYTISITKMSVLNPIGEFYVKAFNIYGSDSTASISQDIVLTDHGDNQPITFQLKDASGVIVEETFTLTDPNLIDSESVEVIGSDPDNSFTFSFSIILQTKKQ